MTQTIKPKKILLLCILLTPLINIGLDIYTPSLPAIQKAFHTTHNAVNMTLLIYTLMFGIVQPIIGPSCDRIGRKPFVWVALFVFLISSIGASFSPNLIWLCVSRLGQGIGAAIIAACIKAILVDCFHGRQLAKANSYFSLAWSLTPIVAPAIGGYLQHHFFWQASFYFMVLYCIICMLFTQFSLPETNVQHKTGMPARKLTHAWHTLLTDRAYLSCAIILAIQFSIIIFYYLSAPYVLQIQLHLNPAQYGQVMLMLGFAYLLGNIANQFLLNHFDIKPIILVGMICGIFASITMGVISKLLTLSVYTATIPVFLIFFTDGFVFANVLTHALTQQKQFPATAGALIGGILNLIGTILTYFSNHFFNLHSLFVLSINYFVILVIALLLFFPAFSSKLNNT